MKKLLLFIVSIIMLALPSEAQLVRSRTFAEKEKSGFNRFSVGYDAMFLDHDFGTLNGVNLQYMHGFRVAKVPLFIELGVDVSYNVKDYIWRSDFYYDSYYDEYYLETYKQMLHSLSLRIPLNISYKINLGDKFSIQPYTGINLKINPLFYDYYINKFEILSDDEYSYLEEEGENKMFQMGWQIGLGFNISKLYIGFQYGIDFMPRASVQGEYEIYNDRTGKYSYNTSSYDFKSSRFLVSLGVNF